MPLDFFNHVTFIGATGAACVEIVSFLSIKEEPSLPSKYKTATYWVATSLQIAMGAWMCHIYETSQVNLNAFMALHIGASAPALITTITKATPKIELGS